MFEIKVTLTADPKLENLLDKLCNTFSFDNSLPFTAEQAAPVKPAASTSVKPAPSVPVTVPVQTAATAVSPTVPFAPTATNAAPAPVTTQPAPAAKPVPPQSTVPTAAPTAYTIEQLQAAVGPLLTQGKGPQLQGLLAKYGVQRLPDMPADKMGLFAADLRGLGAQI